jgi:hypothetical protein
MTSASLGLGLPSLERRTLPVRRHTSGLKPVVTSVVLCLFFANQHWC